MPNTTLRLLSQFFKSPRSVGTILPSSRDLAELMIKPVDFDKPTIIVEYGPGTGAITRLIADRLQPHSRYLGIEINQELALDLSRRFPQLEFINRSATDIGPILRSLGVDKVDAILCGLPWASLPAGLQPLILDGIEKSLRPGGVFVTFAYLPGLILPAAQIFRRELKKRFSKVETTQIVWNNIPPAFTYVCHR